MKPLLTGLVLAGWSLVPAVFAAEPAAPTHRFAAPDVASTPVPGAAGGIGQMLLGLLLVLAVVFAIAFVARRLRGASGVGANGIEVLAQASLGAKEKTVIVRVDGERLLLGVASGQVTLLKTLSAGSDAPPPAVTGRQVASFAALLRRSLGK
jgi:flagellar protein FliO/FliZ